MMSSLPRVRGTAAGLMNTVGWAGGSLAPMAIGFSADRYRPGRAIGSTARIYVVVGILALVAASIAARKSSSPGAFAP